MAELEAMVQKLNMEKVSLETRNSILEKAVLLKDERPSGKDAYDVQCSRGFQVR